MAFILTLPEQAVVFICLLFENSVRKGEIAHVEQFLFFSTVFSTGLKNFLPFSSNARLVVCKLFHFGRVQNLLFGKGFFPFSETSAKAGPFTIVVAIVTCIAQDPVLLHLLILSLSLTLKEFADNNFEFNETAESSQNR